MDIRSLYIIWCNVINKIYFIVILYWELEIRCLCIYFICSWVWINYIVKYKIRFILILRIYIVIYEGLVIKFFRCLRMFWIASNNNNIIYFWFYIWWMKLNRFVEYVWLFLGDMNFFEVKSFEWILCMKKFEF